MLIKIKKWVIVYNSLTQHLFLLSHTEKRPRKERSPRAMILSRPHQCVSSKMQPGYDGCPCVPRPHSRSKVTAGSKVIDSRITPESMSWFMLMLLRYCEDLVPLQTTVYLLVLNFSGGYRHSVHTDEDGFVRRRVFPTLADKVRRSWKSKLSLSCSPKHTQASVVLS